MTIQDNLGSSSVMTNRTGDMVQHYGYTAFGDECYQQNNSAFNVTNRYTGQRIDEETGLYFYNSRYYDPDLGRFLQPDSIVPDSSTSQALNRYAYVKNNPLVLTDPDGHFSLKSVLKKIGKALGHHFGTALIIIGTLTFQPWLVVAGTFYNVYCIGDQKFSSFAKQLAVNMACYYVGQQIAPGPKAEFVECVVRGAAIGAVNGAITSAVYGGNMGRAMYQGAAMGAAFAAAFAVAKSALENLQKSTPGASATGELVPGATKPLIGCGSGLCLYDPWETLRNISPLEWEIGGEKAWIEFEASAWSLRDPTNLNAGYLDGNSGWSIYPKYYQCGDQNYDLAKYINGVLKPKYFTARLIAGGGGNPFTNLWNYGHVYLRHAVVLMVPNSQAVGLGFKRFIIDGFNGPLGRNFQTWDENVFKSIWPKNALDSNKPWTDDMIGLEPH